MEKAPSGMDAVAQRHSDFIFGHPRIILIATILIALLFATGTRYFEVKNNYRVFFGKDNPDLLAFDHLQNTYSKTDNILFAVVPQEGSVFTPETMDAVERLTEKAWTIPYTTRVDSITNFQYSWADGDDLTVEDLIRDAKSMSLEELQENLADRAVTIGERPVSVTGGFRSRRFPYSLAPVAPPTEILHIRVGAW